MGIENQYKDKVCLVFGATGFIGKAVSQRLLSGGATVQLISTRNHDLLHRPYDGYTQTWHRRARPDYVFYCAGKFTGSFRTKDNPFYGYNDNLQMMLNGIASPYAEGVFGTETRLVSISSVCAYPEAHEWSAKEKDIFDGEPHPSHRYYGLAKRELITLGHALRDQFAIKGVTVVLGNTYGEGDNFDAYSSHVIPSLIRKWLDAKKNKVDRMQMYGAPGTTRDFLYIQDAVEGILRLGLAVEDMSHVNLATGQETSLLYLTHLLSRLTDHKIETPFGMESPSQRRIDVTLLRKLTGWVPPTLLETGLRNTINYYKGLLPE